MSNPVFYIPADSASIPHYLGSALIIPAMFCPSKPRDIQNLFPEKVMACSEKWVENCNCSIEVILTAEEIASGNRFKRFILLEKPIPISRIVKIHFRSKTQMEVTTWNTNQGAAFLPKDILALENTTNPVYVTMPTPNDFLDKEKSATEIDDRINRYNVILGGLAFMKAGNLSSKGHTTNYFSTLSTFNTAIDLQMTEASRNSGFNFIKKYGGLFSRSESEWTPWIKYIYSDISVKELESIAGEQGIRIQSKFGLVQIDNLKTDNLIYDLALMTMYGNNKPKSLDELLSFLHKSRLSADKIEEIALLVGLRHGYSKLRNEYQFDTRKFSVKFELNSKLDYYVIESVYQTVFNINRRNSDFPYLLPIIKRFPGTVTNRDADFSILGTPVYLRKHWSEKIAPVQIDPNAAIDSLIRKLVNAQLRLSHPYAVVDARRANSYFAELLGKDLARLLSEMEHQGRDAGRREAENIYQRTLDEKLKKIEELEFKLAATNAPVTNEENKTTIDTAPESPSPTLFGVDPIGEDLSMLTMTELKNIAQQEKVPGVSRLRKGEESKAAQKIADHRKKGKR